MVFLRFATTAILALFASSIEARKCMNLTVPVTISARTGIFGNIAVPVGNLDPTTFSLNLTRQGGNFTAQALTGYNTTSGTYNISAMYCAPAKPYVNNTSIQILTHGIGFDKTYWDIPFDGYEYSYVNTALKAGYHTLSYDRLGLGLSSHAKTSLETRDQIQSFLEVASLAALTRMLRNGTFPNVSTSFTKIIHVGHSFGSAQSYALSAMYPDISDGLVLTGFSMNASFVGYFGAGANFVQANLNQPLRFGSNATATAINTFSQYYGLTDIISPVDLTAIPAPLDYVSGYLTNDNVNSQIYLFLYPGYFDPAIAYFGEQSKQPVTTGELLTLGSLPMTNAFRGPVAVFTGQYDLPYCGGDCLATGGAMANVASGVSMNFPNASAFTAYIQPNTGHGLNFHYNATAGYKYIQRWLSAHNLAA